MGLNVYRSLCQKGKATIACYILSVRLNYLNAISGITLNS